MKNLIAGLTFIIASAITPAIALAQDTPSGTPESDQTYLSFQVDKIVRVKTRSVPTYPERLRAAHVQGEVLVQFSVDERGAPVMDTFKVIRSTNEAFTNSVQRAVSVMTFHPAEAKGRKVKQLVQQEFKFAS